MSTNGGDMLTKTYDVEVKADSGDPGSFTALVSVFDNIDLVGDRVKRGAFTKSLRKWRESGDPIPIVLSHQWDDPHAHIGIADPKQVRQTKVGLELKGQLDVVDNAVAAQVYKLLKRRSLKAFSFGYSVEKEEIAEDGANDLLEVDLIEAGPTLKGANPEAQLQAIKSALETVETVTKPEVDETPAPSEEVEDPPDEEPPAKSTGQDPLRRQINQALLENALGSSQEGP